MIAMQYSFDLPADYDMSIIRRRIEERGHLTDAFAGLAFKAYLFQLRNAGTIGPPCNRYAPFYVWDDEDGMNRFLAGPGFEALTTSFGWPQVGYWPIWAWRCRPGLTTAAWAIRERLPITPFAQLAALRAAESELVAHRVEHEGALASVVAYDPQDWRLVRFSLWADNPSCLDRQAVDHERYQVGHVSAPDQATI
jgi:hypothetical protein